MIKNANAALKGTQAAISNTSIDVGVAIHLTASEAHQKMIALAYETAWGIESKAMMDRATIALATGSD